MNAPRSPIRQKSVRDDGAAMLCGISVFAGRWLVRQQPNAFHPASQYRVAQLGNRLLAREGLAPDQGDAPMRARWNERFGQQARALVGTVLDRQVGQARESGPPRQVGKGA